MKNYRKLILDLLSDALGPVELVEDPNSYIDNIIEGAGISWYPSFLAIQESRLYMFIPFDLESYIDTNEIKGECSRARVLIESLQKRRINATVLFITEKVEDSEVLRELNLEDGFGILHNEVQEPVIEFTISEKSIDSCHLLPSVLEYLSQCNNLKGSIGNLIRRFSRTYVQAQHHNNDEDDIKELIEKILSCDKRFKLRSQAIKNMADIERFLTQRKIPLRDHYFHACNTMLIGFMIIDMHYELFGQLCKVYGDDIVLEFIWVITSLYHDIGYPAKLQPQLISQIYNIEVSEPVIETGVRQIRQNIWERKYFVESLILSNLFGYLNGSSKGDKWVYDGFARKKTNSKFDRGLRIAFIEKGAHGAQGVLMLVAFINEIIQDITDQSDRQFLYRHIAIAAISTLFHDSVVRNVFREISIKKIKASLFPLSMLLAYVDILQDDRRDISGSLSKPDIFGGIVDVENTILATLNQTALDQSTRQKLMLELHEALEFFVLNGISFSIPNELRN